MAIIDFFKKSLANDHLSNSYLILGSLKDSEIEELLNLLLEASSEKESSAKSVESLIVESNEKGNIRREQANKILSFARLKPVLSKRRVVIIKDSHNLNRDAANHLLKIIEEPPQYLIFLLLTHRPEYLPETIISRCISLKSEKGKRSLSNKLKKTFEKLLKSDLNSRFLFAEKLSKKNQDEIIAFLDKWLIFLSNNVQKHAKLIKNIKKTKTVLERTYVNPRLALERLFVKMD